MPRETNKSAKDDSLPAEVKELASLIVAYARQETIDPLKQLGRWVAYGVAGAVLIGLGCVLLGVGLLRALQAETGDHLADNLSWVPYLIVVIFLGAVIGLMVRLMSRGPGSKEQ